jgi:hypothetical protein
MSTNYPNYVYVCSKLSNCIGKSHKSFNNCINWNFLLKNNKNTIETDYFLNEDKTKSYYNDVNFLGNKFKINNDLEISYVLNEKRKSYKDNLIVFSFCDSTFCFKYSKIHKMDWMEIVELLEKQLQKAKKQKYYNLTKKVQKLLNDSNIIASCYPASYGIGLDYYYNYDYENEFKRITDFLSKEGIIYKNEESDAKWIMRFKISKNKDNI